MITAESNAALHFQGGTSLVFSNTGTIKAINNGKIDLAGATHWTNNDNGTVEANGGTVLLGTPSNYSGNTLNGGTWRVFADSTLQFDNGVNIQTNKATIAIDGANSKIVDMAGMDVLADLTMNASQGQLTIGGGRTFTVGQPVTNNGTIILQTGATLSLAANVTTSSAGIFNWTEGTLNGSNTFALVFTGGGQLNLSGDSQKTLQGPRVTVQNAGTATWTGSGKVIIVSGSGSKFTNAGGLFDIQGDADFVGDGVFENMMGGMVKKSQTNGTTLFGTNVEFRNNSATVEVETGELQLQNYTDTGNLMLNNGTLTFGSDVTVNAFAWTGGTLKNSGMTTINGAGLMITGSAAKVLDGGILANSAAGTWTGSGPILLRNGALFSNDATLDSQGDGAISWIGGALSSFQNNGTFVKSPVSGTTTLVNVPFNNIGTVDVQGGTLLLASFFNNFANQTLTGGTYIVQGTLQFIDANIQTNAATIILDGPNSMILDDNNNDALAAFATNLGQFTIQNGALVNTSVDFTNFGSLTLGQGSTFTTAGNVTLDPSGTLEIHLADHPQTGQFGQLVTMGQANVAGTLTIVLDGNFQPDSADQFQIVSSISENGRFDNINPPPGWMVDPPDYEDTGVTIKLHM
jgi:hypothetical protein